MQADDFRSDLPVSRGQWKALALAALDELQEIAPASRMDATELLVRFEKAARARQAAGPHGAYRTAASG